MPSGAADVPSGAVTPPAALVALSPEPSCCMQGVPLLSNTREPSRWSPPAGEMDNLTRMGSLPTSNKDNHAAADGTTSPQKFKLGGLFDINDILDYRKDFTSLREEHVMSHSPMDIGAGIGDFPPLLASKSPVQKARSRTDLSCRSTANYGPNERIAFPVVNLVTQPEFGTVNQMVNSSLEARFNIKACYDKLYATGRDLPSSLLQDKKADDKGKGPIEESQEASVDSPHQDSRYSENQLECFPD